MTRAAGSGAGGQGTFVTFEGPEGSGKTTHAARLAGVASAAGIPVVLTREPGGTAVGERIRDLLLRSGADGPALAARTDALLFNAARAQLVAEVIRPALARGELVVCARFADSTVAYQGAGHGLPPAELRELEAFATGGLRPDLTVLLDLPVEAGLRRKAAAEQTRFETDFDLAFHERVRAGFLALAAREPERFAVIDAGRPEPDVFAAVVTAVARLPALACLAAEPRTGAAGPARAPSDPAARPERMER